MFSSTAAFLDPLETSSPSQSLPEPGFYPGAGSGPTTDIVEGQLNPPQVVPLLSFVFVSFAD